MYVTRSRRAALARSGWRPGGIMIAARAQCNPGRMPASVMDSEDFDSAAAGVHAPSRARLDA